MTVQTPHAAVVVLLHMGRSNMVRQCAGLSQTPTVTVTAAAAGDAVGAADAQAADLDRHAAATAPGSSSSSGASQQAGGCQLEGDQCDRDASDTTISSSINSQQQGLKVPADDAADPTDHPAAAAAAESNVLSAAVFDPVRPHRLFGVTAGGDLITLLVPSAQRNFCKVRQQAWGSGALSDSECVPE